MKLNHTLSSLIRSSKTTNLQLAKGANRWYQHHLQSEGLYWSSDLFSFIVKRAVDMCTSRDIKINNMHKIHCVCESRLLYNGFKLGR